MSEGPSRVWTLAIGITGHEEQSRWNVVGRVGRVWGDVRFCELGAQWRGA